MNNLSDLETQARLLAQSGQPDAALGLYQSFLEQTPGEPMPWAQAGKLQLHLGRMDAAAESIARAVDLFSAIGLGNVAIALCHRMLRADPDRRRFYLRAGELSVAHGYMRDAKLSYLEYAERSERQGDPSAAIEALRDFLRHAPGDPAVRRRLEELGAADEPPVAADELPVAAARPEPQDAMDWPSERDEPEQSDQELLGLLSTTEEFPRETATEWEVVSLVPSEHEVEAVPADDGVLPLEGLEPTLAEPRSEDASTAADDDDLPLLGAGFDLPSAVEDLPKLSPEALEDAPVIDHQPDEPEPLPLLGFEPAASTDEVDPLDDLLPPDLLPPDPLVAARERVHQSPGNSGAWREYVSLLQTAGRAEELSEALESAHRALAAAGDHAGASEFAERLVAQRPDDFEVLQQWVEYAFRSGDRPRLIGACLALASHLEREREPSRAREAYQRVLELDPAHEDARRAVARLSPAGSPPRDYVDLGALIFSDEPEEERTRFQVEAAEPTGDEEADFSEILDLFRKKVADTIDPKDATSHYDLGLAFKEMGLLDDAIAQLQRALRGGADPLATLEVLGACFVEKGDYGLAARVLERATQLQGASETDMIGVYYWLGRCREELGEARHARGCYEHVVAVDIGFQDAASRLEALRSV